MDKRVIAKKIDSILRCLDRIRQRLQQTEGDFLRDYIAVHSYDDIDLAITYTIAQQHLVNFADYLQEISGFVRLKEER